MSFPGSPFGAIGDVCQVIVNASLYALCQLLNTKHYQTRFGVTRVNVVRYVLNAIKHVQFDFAGFNGVTATKSQITC